MILPIDTDEKIRARALTTIRKKYKTTVSYLKVLKELKARQNGTDHGRRSGYPDAQE